MSVEGYIGLDYAKNYILPRKDDAHKGDCGRVLIVAGSYGMAGAAVLCTRAALRTGAGLVTAAVPDRLFDILQISVPEAMCVERESLFHEGALAKYDAIAIGPGLGVSRENFELITGIIENSRCQMVIDADGLNTLCRYDENFEKVRRAGERIVLTPHPGEAGRILACAGEGPVSEMGREQAVRRLADFTGATVLLKGKDTLVTQQGDGISCNTTGNPGMATGGSGDVLTGVIAALLANGWNTGVAARTGAYVHGKAGDLASERTGEWGMTAMDIAECLPAVLKYISGR
ncbi:MAG: NAD(P)H-hydrate dehydratase [Firmicutes bacterium]|nr:NAD(P)H-hydrate dehydratase [Bacillota bacterium]